MTISAMGSGLAVCVFLFTGCAKSEKDGTGELVEDLVALQEEIDDLDCECNPDDCSVERYSTEEVNCFKTVFARNEQAEPELRCVAGSLSAQRDCFAHADCSVVSAWEACYDQGEDCDESIRDGLHMELEACFGEEHDQGSAAP